MRNAPEAADYARQRANSGEDMAASGYCLQFTRENYPIGSYYYSAIDAWNASQYPHPGGNPDSVPAGYPGYWKSSSPYRHVAVCLGDGTHATVFNEEIEIRSTSDMVRYFGPWIGWAEDLNTVFIPAGSTPPPPGGGGGDSDMFMIRNNKSTGETILVSLGRYLVLGSDSAAAYAKVPQIGAPTVLPTADYNTIKACAILVTDAVDLLPTDPVKRGTQEPYPGNTTFAQDSANTGTITRDILEAVKKIPTDGGGSGGGGGGPISDADVQRIAEATADELHARTAE